MENRNIKKMDKKRKTLNMFPIIRERKLMVN